jgi:hypothetical protein
MSAPKKPFRREDRPGHLDPEHAARLRALSVEEHRGTSSDPDPRVVFRSSADGGLAEELGERAILVATTGDDPLVDELEAEVTEEHGGPFVETTAGQEMAEGTDASNPADAEREPFPKT